LGRLSRRALLAGLSSLGSVLALGGCASMGATGARFDASSLSVDPTLLVTTTRKPVNVMGHKWIANAVVYTAAADERIRNIWGNDLRVRSCVSKWKTDFIQPSGRDSMGWSCRPAASLFFGMGRWLEAARCVTLQIALRKLADI
jgi:hypothetical protein